MIDKDWADNLSNELKILIMESAQTALNKEKQLPLILTANEAAEMIGVSITTFHEQWASEPDFPRTKRGTYDAFPRDPVIEWVKNNYMKVGREI